MCKGPVVEESMNSTGEAKERGGVRMPRALIVARGVLSSHRSSGIKLGEELGMCVTRSNLRFRSSLQQLCGEQIGGPTGHSKAHRRLRWFSRREMWQPARLVVVEMDRNGGRTWTM